MNTYFNTFSQNSIDLSFNLYEQLPKPSTHFFNTLLVGTRKALQESAQKVQPG